MIPDDVHQALDLNWSVIPIKRNKRPYFPWRHHQTERASLEQVTQWQETLSPPAWACVTGPTSGMAALDFDGAEGRATMESFHLKPHTRSGSGGAHLYVTHPGAHISTLNSKSSQELARHFPGLDLRGDGGYIIFTGENEVGMYERLRPLHPDPFESLPEPLAAVMLGKAPSSRQEEPADVLVPPLSPQSDDEQMASLIREALDRALSEGRNNAGFHLACALRDAGLSQDEAERAMQVYQMHTLPIDRRGATTPYTLAEAMASLEQAYSRARRRISMRPTIGITARYLDEKVNDAIDALHVFNDPPSMFERGGAMVRITADGSGQHLIQPVTKDILRYALSNAADFVKLVNGEDEVPVDPPMATVSSVLAHPDLKLPNLKGISVSPILRSDGTVASTVGFDTMTGFYLGLKHDFQLPVVPDDPTEEHVGRARTLILDELLGEFCFRDQASRANAVAYLLTLVIRPVIPGLVPMALISAPSKGTGKTMLVNAGAILATGRSAKATTATPNEEEFRKRLTAMLYAGETLIFLDNLEDVLRSSALAVLLTSDRWGDRLLGVSKFVDFEHQAVCVATGNNLKIGGDLGRRCYPINLDALVARPWERTFRHPDLDAWICENRADLLWAIFVLARHWWAQGQPSPSAPVLAGYHGWIRMVGGILECAGIDGFLGNLHELYETADEETTDLANFVTIWFDTHGSTPITVAEFRLAANDRLAQALPATIAEQVEAAASPIAAQSRLGQFLARIEGRRFDDRGLRIERAGRDRHTKAICWHAVRD